MRLVPPEHAPSEFSPRSSDCVRGPRRSMPRMCAVRLTEGETSSRCVTCFRFKLSNSMLTASSYCSCLCDCHNVQEDDDASDSDYTPSTTSSTSSVQIDDCVTQGEIDRLSKGLTFWEIHDVSIITGRPLSQLVEAFPEIEQVHGRTSDQGIDAPPSICSHCRLTLPRALSDAIQRCAVKNCDQCSRPALAPPQATY